MLYVLNGFFKRTLKFFLFLLFNQAHVLKRSFSLEYHIFKYLIMGGYCQNHVDNNIILLGYSHCCLFPEHGLKYVLMRAIINFIFNGIIDEVVVNDGTRFVHFSMTSFVTGFISYTTRLCQNSIHHYIFLSLSLFFGLFKFQWQCFLECPS